MERHGIGGSGSEWGHCGKGVRRVFGVISGWQSRASAEQWGGTR